MNQNDVINRTFFFIHNIPSNFIEEIWKNTPLMASHLRSKFNCFCSAERYTSANAISKFFAALDEGNAEKFCSYAATWIKQHN